MVGGGSAGLIAARTARLLGGRVLLIERGRLGGDCLWTGCVPSKALIAEARVTAAGALAGVRERAAAGPVFRAVNLARDRIAPTDSVESLERIGVTVRLGHAEFAGQSQLRVDGDLVGFRNAVIATGSEPVIPDVPGLADASPVTSDTVWDLAEIPGRLLVVGGGAIGCELGQAFARLGSEVTIVHRGGEILPGEDSSARPIIRRALEADGCVS